MAEFHVSETIDEAQREAIHRGLREHNLAANPEFWAAMDDPRHDARPLYVVALDAEQKPIGGLIAETRFAWLKVSIISVREDARRDGLGRRLMQLAEDVAVSRGCRHAYADTMDYQAPGFYERL